MDSKQISPKFHRRFCSDSDFFAKASTERRKEARGAPVAVYAESLGQRGGHRRSAQGWPLHQNGPRGKKVPRHLAPKEGFALPSLSFGQVALEGVGLTQDGVELLFRAAVRLRAGP